MTFFNRAAGIAAMTLGITGMIGASTPGFALELDKSVNVSTSLPVPKPVVTPAVVTTPVPSDTTRTETPDPTASSASQADADDDTPEYASLSEAVAAQDDSEALDRDLTCMAGAVYFEAKGEPLSGQLAVADVIINRTKSGRFPTTICSVVTQPGQFSFVHGGHIPTIANSRAYRTAVAVARVAMADAWDSPAANAMYFHARRVSPGWRMQKVASIGNHIFYR
jgi:spore germination cell wall hydrolase CwlJ-like protein